uniref:PAS domain-containing protein n=1 Tax=Desertifilum tharense IPPAS B-1220 TaxID=1781255 RepID=A0ACD5GYJ4_9CYAN
MTLARAVSRGEVVVDEEIGFLRGDGTRGTMLVNATPVRDRQGNITAGVVTFNDISDRTSAVAALQESEARFRGWWSRRWWESCFGNPKAICSMPIPSPSNSSVTIAPKSKLDRCLGERLRRLSTIA